MSRSFLYNLKWQAAVSDNRASGATTKEAMSPFLCKHQTEALFSVNKITNSLMT